MPARLMARESGDGATGGLIVRRLTRIWRESFRCPAGLNRGEQTW